MLMFWRNHEFRESHAASKPQVSTEHEFSRLGDPGMAIERLQQAFRHIGGQRFYVVFGPGVADHYVNSQYMLLDFETALVETLRQQDFERIVFWSAGGNVYFRDQQSRGRRSPETISHEPLTGTRTAHRTRFCRPGPLQGSSAIGRSAPLDPVPRSRIGGHAYDAIALGHLNSFMCEEMPRTAVVINLPETTFSVIAGDRDLSRLLQDQLHRWNNLPPTNLNACILVFAVGDHAQLVSVVERLPSFQFLQGPITAWGQDPASRNVARLEPPGKNEIERLVDYARIRYPLQIDWVQRDSIIKALAGQSLPGDLWLRQLRILQKRGGRLSMDEVRSMIPELQGDDPRKTLDSLIGLTPVKDKIKELEIRVRGLKEMRETGRVMTAGPPYLHMVFSGNPGTGKTTVAELIGRIYADIGILDRGQTLKVAGKDLTGQDEGHTQQRVNQAVDRALDGVLFIDEAYQLAQGSDHGFGQEALNALVDRLSRDRGRLVVIIAGYTKDMERLLEANVGLPSRFPEENRFEFPDYSPDELWKILRKALSNRGLQAISESESQLREIVTQMYARRPAATWDNARAMEKFADRIQSLYMQRNLGHLAANPSMTIEDIPDSDRENLRPQIPEIVEILKELNELVGLRYIKDWVREQVHLLRLEDLQRRQGVQLDAINLNMVFLGNPGTGKTTVARLMGRIFKALGRLHRGQVTEVRRENLVAGYVGQTAIKTSELIQKEALDGILFIDEAYALAASGAQTDFGSEAVEAIMGALDRYPDRLAVIVAGYPQPMQRFLESNEGLPRRLGERVRFPDYSDPELLEIMRRMVAKEKFPQLTAPVELAVLDYLRAVRTSDPERFGNAGEVKLLFEKMKRKMAARIFSGETTADPGELPSFEVRDVPGFEVAQQAGSGTIERQSFALVPLLPRDTQSELTSEAACRAVVLVEVVFPDGTRGSGTGFVVTPRGHCLTAFHVLQRAKTITVTFEASPQQRIPVQMIGWDREADLAVLQLPADEYAWIGLASVADAAVRSEEVLVVGYPFGEELGRELSFKRGTVSSLRERNGVQILEVDAAATHGSSGAPVLRLKDYCAIGMIHGGLEDVAGFNFAVDVREVYWRFP